MDSPNQFWPSSSPLSSKKREDRKMSRHLKITTNIAKSDAKTRHPTEKSESMKNGILVINNAMNKNDENEIFKVPGAQNVPRSSFRSHEKNNSDLRKESNRNGQKVGLKPKISEPSWRGFSKTCDCIEKGNTSPVLRLTEQARAVSSPDPLHRPDNSRASTLSATATQTLR